MELFLRENAGSDVFDRLDPALRERILANGPLFFEHELAMFLSWTPSEAELDDSAFQSARWLAGTIGARTTIARQRGWRTPCAST